MYDLIFTFWHGDEMLGYNLERTMNKPEPCDLNVRRVDAPAVSELCIISCVDADTGFIYWTEFYIMVNDNG